MPITRREFLTTTPLAASLGRRSPQSTIPDAIQSVIAPARAGSLGPAAASRLIMHWYVFGPAWTGAEAVRQLRLMHDAHIGGVLIFPTYPVAVDDFAKGIRNQRYLSDEFFDVLNAVLDETNRLGMTADMVIGTGWPYGGPSVSIDDSAHALRMRRGAAGNNPDPDERVISAIGDGDQRLVFYSAPTRMQVKRAAVGGEGLIVDHYRPDALMRYLDAVAGRIMARAPKGLRAFFCDSLEVYHANWSADMPAQFSKRRGYDLIPRLPALFDAGHADARDVRCDFWRTCSELAVDAFLAPLHEWTRAHGIEIQVEAYGTPPVNLTGFRHVDVPVGEHYEWKEFSTSRWASSGAHLAGKPIVLAEAWTWTGLPNRFADTLESLKLCSDLHFMCGINALYGVTYAYSPIDLGSPGWPPYFGPVVNHTQPYWPYMSALSDYVAGTCQLLQLGTPVNDVLLYLPAEDCMADAGPDQLLLNWVTRDRMSSLGQPPEFSLPHALHFESNVVTTIMFSGFGFDGIDTFCLNTGTRVQQGRLEQGHGRYSIVVLPNLTGIDPASLDLLATFVADGGTLIATRRLPERAWGIADRERNTERVRTKVREMFGSPPPRAAIHTTGYGRGRTIFVRNDQGSFREALRRATPDADLEPSNRHVGFVHRHTATADIYFLANTAGDPQDLDIVFRDSRTHVHRYDPCDGSRTALPTGRRPGSWRVPLDGYGSCAIVFSEEPIESLTRTWLVDTNGSHIVRWSNGETRRSVRDLPAPRELTGTWTLTPLSDKTERVELRQLRSWTELEPLKFFSGIISYEISFDAPLLGKKTRIRLDLGRVHETADVSLNGRKAGLRWMRPFALDITSHLIAGTNHLRIDVSNTVLNKVLGLGPIDYSQVVTKYGDRFPWGDEWTVVREPRTSGLLGPVRLVFFEDIG